MPMRIPEADNPYRVDIERTNTSVDSVGLVAAPEAKNATVNAVQGLTKSSFDVLEKAQKFKKLQDETQSLDLINQLKTEGEKLKNDSETGFKRLKGKDALSMPDGSSIHDTYNGRLQNLVRTLADKAGNPEVRAKFNKFAQDYGYNFQNELNAHTIKQAQEYATSVQNNALKLAYDDAMSGTLDEYDANASVIKGIIDQNAKIKGVEPDYSKVMGTLHADKAALLIDSGNLKIAKSFIEQRKSEMEVRDYLRLKRSITDAQKRLAAAARVNNSIKKYVASMTPYNIARSIYKETTKSDLSEDQYNQSLDLAGGNPVEALQIALIGPDKYKAAVDEWAETGKVPDVLKGVNSNTKALSTMAQRMGALNGKSLEQMVGVVMDDNPDMTLQDAYATARGVIKKSKQNYGVASENRNHQAGMLLGEMLKGTSIDELPDSQLNALPYSVRVAVKQYQNRAASNSLATDHEAMWELRHNPERLKNLTQLELVNMAKDFSPNDFQWIVQRSNDLKTGRVTDIKANERENRVKNALALQGFKNPTDREGRAINSFLTSNLNDAVAEEELNRGKPMTQEETTQFIGKELSTTYTSKTKFLGFIPWDSETDAVDVAKGKSINIDGTTKDILTKGLQSIGVLDPNDASLTDLILQVKLVPGKPIHGASAMVQALKDEDVKAYDAIKNAYVKRNGRAPTDDQIIRLYLEGAIQSKR